MSDMNFNWMRALVVEDNDFVRFMVKKYLTEFGFSAVDEAKNGIEGIEMLSEAPDVVICDISMEPLNGFEFLKHLRNLPDAQKDTPVIFLTSNADVAAVQQAKTLNVSSYLLKPVQPDLLRKKIAGLICSATH